MYAAWFGEDTLPFSLHRTRDPCSPRKSVRLHNDLSSAAPPARPTSTLHSFAVIMLDSFEIISTSGVVLWSRSYAPVKPSIINGLIRDVFIEEKALPGASVQDDASAARNPVYKKDQYTLKWTTVKDLGLIFVVSAAVLLGGFS